MRWIAADHRSTQPVHDFLPWKSSREFHALPEPGRDSFAQRGEVSAGDARLRVFADDDESCAGALREDFIGRIYEFFDSLFRVQGINKYDEAILDFDGWRWREACPSTNEARGVPSLARATVSCSRIFGGNHHGNHG